MLCYNALRGEPMKLSWHVIGILTAVGLQGLGAFTAAIPVKYAAFGMFAVSLLQALHTLAAKYDTPPNQPPAQ